MNADERREARRRAARRRIEPDAAPAGETALRSKPVRITVDLAPELYRRLTRWTTEVAEEIDAAKVTTADIVRAYIRACDDPEVRARVVAELRELKQ
ncbi:hypothetical protein ACQP1K_29450 (plasmid) [Sphaerimonospora sp. CA-214678]|uniref:hypothetical protein n=1 Tax=Sphaerimonospora sp. CA-214678 TaxID=3240029 RepID=UPI003D8FAC19